MEHPHFFGYGSLVNRETHDFTPVHAARIRGWQRIWQRAPKRPVAFLSVIRDRDATIEGVIAPVPNDDWQTLDAREFSYDRVLVTDTVAHTATSVRDVSIYAIPSPAGQPPDEDHPILLSYVDAVLQGFLREFGEDGATRFVATTLGWDAPIRDDRADPLYPRARRLLVQETEFVDDALADLGVRVLT